MAATVAAPLERRLGEIAGVTEITSHHRASASTRIALQFDLSRSIDGAARDVQAALNAAMADLPSDMPTLPTFRKANPNAMPVLILALTSKTHAAERALSTQPTPSSCSASRRSTASPRSTSPAPSSRPSASRSTRRSSPSMGLSMEEVRLAIANANAVTPLGTIDGDRHLIALETNAQLRTVDDYKRDHRQEHLDRRADPRSSDVATVEQGTRNTRSSALFNLQPAVILFITKQGDANVIETVDRDQGASSRS